VNHVSTVGSQLAKRVWKVVDEPGYFPNTQARALVSGRSSIFGLIVTEITNPFSPQVVETFENLPSRTTTKFRNSADLTVYDPKRMELSVRRMIERRVDGVAVLTFGMEEAEAPAA
jgi:LacI family transcriptional regulator